MADPLVTLEDAKVDLRIDGSDSDARITLHLAAAADWVSAYINPGVDGLPTDSAALSAMKSATFLRLRDLYLGSGEGPDTKAACTLINPWRNLRV